MAYWWPWSAAPEPHGLLRRLARALYEHLMDQPGAITATAGAAVLLTLVIGALTLDLVASGWASLDTSARIASAKERWAEWLHESVYGAKSPRSSDGEEKGESGHAAAAESTSASAIATHGQPAGTSLESLLVRRKRHSQPTPHAHQRQLPPHAWLKQLWLTIVVRIGEVRNLLCSPCARARRKYQSPATCPLPAFKEVAGLYRFVFGYRTSGCTYVTVGCYDGEAFSFTSGLADVGWIGHEITPVRAWAEACRLRHVGNAWVTVHHLHIGDESTAGSMVSVQAVPPYSAPPPPQQPKLQHQQAGAHPYRHHTYRQQSTLLELQPMLPPAAREAWRADVPSDASVSGRGKGNRHRRARSDPAVATATTTTVVASAELALGARDSGVSFPSNAAPAASQAVGTSTAAIGGTGGARGRHIHQSQSADLDQLASAAAALQLAEAERRRDASFSRTHDHAPSLTLDQFLARHTRIRPPANSAAAEPVGLDTVSVRSSVNGGLTTGTERLDAPSVAESQSAVAQARRMRRGVAAWDNDRGCTSGASNVTGADGAITPSAGPPLHPHLRHHSQGVLQPPELDLLVLGAEADVSTVLRGFSLGHWRPKLVIHSLPLFPTIASSSSSDCADAVGQSASGGVDPADGLGSRDDSPMTSPSDTGSNGAADAGGERENGGGSVVSSAAEGGVNENSNSNGITARQHHYQQAHSRHSQQLLQLSASAPPTPPLPGSDLRSIEAYFHAAGYTLLYRDPFVSAWLRADVRPVGV